MGFMSNLLVLSTLLVGIDAEASLLQKARVSGHSSKAMNLQSEVMNLESEARNLEAEMSSMTICTETITMDMSSMEEVMSRMKEVECGAISGDSCGLTFEDEEGDRIDDSCKKHKQECEDGKISFMQPSGIKDCVVEVATKHYFVFKFGDTYYGNAPRSGTGCGLAEIKQTNDNKAIFALTGTIESDEDIVAALGSTNFTCSCKITNFESVTVVDEFKPTAVTVPKPSSKAPFQQTMANVGKVILATVEGVDCALELTKGSKQGWPTKQGGCKFETPPVQETSPVSDQDAPSQGDDDDQ